MCKTGENAESQAKMLHVVAVAALLRGAVACGSCCDDAGEPMSVGVVGAGFAGLGAATRLAELGCSVTVLEARARAGGRAETKSVGGYDVDIGAQWLHGMRRHPLLPFIEAYGMTWTPTDYGDAVAYNATSPTPRVPSSVLDAWGESWEDEVYPQVAKMQDDTNEDEPLATAVASVVSRLGAAAGALARRAVLRFVLANNVELTSAADADDLSLWWWDSSPYLDDDVATLEDAVVIPGYGVLAERIAADLDAEVVFDAPVSAASVADGQVAVATTTGNSYVFDRVVVALPLGVLQTDAVKFSPPLDDDALAARGAGVAEKYVLVFDRVFWPDDDFLYTVQPDPLEWLNLDRAIGAPSLACFAVGSLALRLAQLSDAEKTAYFVDTLRRMFPGVGSIDVVASEYSDWHADERTLGGWSYVKPGAAYRSNDRRLKKPILAGLGALAGEYVAEMFGTTAGAWLSGVAAAECVVEGLCSGLKPASDGAAAPGLGAAVLLAVVAVWC